MEIWDLYDENRCSINRIHYRAKLLSAGEYHLVVEIWTVNSNGEILLTLRHPDKKEFPNTWENTGGSVIAGETSTEGAVRELKEETGILACESELVLLGTKKEGTAFFDTYIVHKDIAIEHLSMQEGETVSAQWVTLEKLDDMICMDLLSYPLVDRFKYYRNKIVKYITCKSQPCPPGVTAGGGLATLT